MEIDWIEAGKLCASYLPSDREDIVSLYDQGVRAIVTLTESPLTEQDTRLSALVEKLGITLLHVPIRDHRAPTRAQVEQITVFIDAMLEQGRPVYIHCLAGIGRTGTALHAYYLLKGESLPAAQARVKAARPGSNYDSLADVQQAFLVELAASLRGG